jgi:hypothetical protein
MIEIRKCYGRGYNKPELVFSGCFDYKTCIEQFLTGEGRIEQLNHVKRVSFIDCQIINWNEVIPLTSRMHLKHLSIRNCGQNMDLVPLSKAHHKIVLFEYEQHDSSITAECMNKICDALEYQHHLVTLKITDFKRREKGEMFHERLFHIIAKSHLRSLSIFTGMDFRALKSLCYTVKQLNNFKSLSLSKLSMSWMALANDPTKEISVIWTDFCSFVANCVTLKQLSLTLDGLKETKGTLTFALLDAISKNKALRGLWLSGLLISAKCNLNFLNHAKLIDIYDVDFDERKTFERFFLKISQSYSLEDVHISCYNLMAVLLQNGDAIFSWYRSIPNNGFLLRGYFGHVLYAPFKSVCERNCSNLSKAKNLCKLLVFVKRYKTATVLDVIGKDILKLLCFYLFNTYPDFETWTKVHSLSW